MSEINLGEYIRTNKGAIGQIIEKRLGKFFKGKDDDETPILRNVYELDTKQWTTDEYIVKHSKNIAELIEVGDIVCIKDIMYDSEYKSEVFENFDNILCINNSEGDEIIELNENIENKQIELLSILTHEQYKQNCYKVVE